MLLLGCNQMNNIFNKKGRLLDLCFSNSEVLIERTDPILEEDVYHPALSIQSIHVSCTASMKLFKEPQYSFKKANYIALNDFFLNTNWLELYNIKTVDEKLLGFYEKIKLGISEHVPVYTNNRKCKSLSIICYNNYVTRMKNLIHEDTTQFWNFVKSKRRKDLNIPSTMNWSEYTANTDDEVSNLFASYFKSIYMGTHDSSVNQVKKLPTDYDANLFQLE
ncbi:Protein of unknown function, partial [Cotesia congregata]